LGRWGWRRCGAPVGSMVLTWMDPVKTRAEAMANLKRSMLASGNTDAWQIFAVTKIKECRHIFAGNLLARGVCLYDSRLAG